MRIVFTDAFTMNPGDLSWKSFENLGEIIIYEHTKESDLVARIKDADIIVVNKTILSSESLAECKNLKLVCVSATGFNNIDIDYLNENNIPACNAAGYSSPAVAQHVVAMILHVYNSVAYYNETVKQGRWKKSRDFCYYDKPIEEIQDKVVGIVGFGNIGRSVAELLSKFGAEIKIMHYDGLKNIPSDYEVLRYDNFLSTCDIVTLHVPLKNSNKGMVNRQFLEKMKNDSILVNTARGPLINEDDLRDCLVEKQIRAACLDVRIEEPPQNDDLKHLENCIITPHQAWASKQSRQRLMRIVAENVKSFSNGNLQNRITD